MKECYFTPSKGTTSATICSYCGKEKSLHTIGDDIKASSIIITSQPKINNMKTDEEVLKLAEEYARSTYKYPVNSKGEEYVHRASHQNPPFWNKHKKEIIPAFIAGYKASIPQ